jgi:hypothetical protein
MIRSAIAAFAVVCVCIGLMQIPPLGSAPPMNCPGGVCPVPMRVTFETLPVPQAVSVVPVSASEQTVSTSYQQVTHTAYTSARYTAVRRPIRSLASLPVRVMQRQPVRTALRRVFCR